MSKTYRKNRKELEPKRGDMIFFGHVFPGNEPSNWKDTADRKQWHKPDKSFKKMKKRQRRAKERDAFRHYDPDASVIPEFPKTDVWEWS